MTVIGITGHQELPSAARVHALERIDAVLTQAAAPVIGLSSLAKGADQLFAELLLRSGGTLFAVIPSHDYATTFSGAARDTYLRLRAAAKSAVTLDHHHASDAAFDEAGRFVVEHSDLLVAVWDGSPARGTGGTADVVAHAHRLNRPVTVVWPDGLARP
ncbi:hypothetical protein [Amycolatopsis sp. YIM 10]|uniref:hypothetical protein n=1 Tax=Amycolatopsis sp. YIM 10 TaxID=2653857 RepID=UPI0012905736|nr:hypothetical protein [Amycolatopsis sp. YIM 10]QFU86580.1 hypothetical protein YIM_06840 [Amycolatopsis sp. YIM 10]